jgi:hypothetical protein
VLSGATFSAVDARSDTATVEPLLSVRQACAVLNIARSTLYGLVRRGELVPTYVASVPRFEAGELRDFVVRNRRRRESDMPEHEQAVLDDLQDVLDAREISPNNPYPGPCPSPPDPFPPGDGG